MDRHDHILFRSYKICCHLIFVEVCTCVKKTDAIHQIFATASTSPLHGISLRLATNLLKRTLASCILPKGRNLVQM
ncbi:hypothetical protein ACB092_04G004800 [Castanea dentata]